MCNSRDYIIVNCVDSRNTNPSIPFLFFGAKAVWVDSCYRQRPRKKDHETDRTHRTQLTAAIELRIKYQSGVQIYLPVLPGRADCIAIN